MNKDLERVVQQEVDAIGYDVVLLRQGGTKSRPVLELRIDRRDGERVSIADCVRVYVGRHRVPPRRLVCRCVRLFLSDRVRPHATLCR